MLYYKHITINLFALLENVQIDGYRKDKIYI